jgi:hypothetical protein
VKFETKMRGIVTFALAASLAALAGSGADKKDKDAGPKYVDAGTFGVFVGGQRVASETFHIQQQNSNSIIQSELKEGNGTNPALQKSDLEITATGELLHYDWSQTAGGSLSVSPNNDFLIEKITTPTSTKPAEQPFLMPSTSSILDNNFFIHREVLAWRFLAADCKQEADGLKCQKDPGEFGVLVPQDRTSIHVRLELVGKEKVTIRGSERELLRLNLMGESFTWSLWLDDRDQFKLMRVAIPADNTEVVRD